MKTFAPLLAVIALSTFDGASAFTVRPPLATATTTGNVVASRSTIIPATQLFMSTKEKDDTSAPIAADEEVPLLQKVKQAGTAGGEFNSSTHRQSKLLIL